MMAQKWRQSTGNMRIGPKQMLTAIQWVFLSLPLELGPAHIINVNNYEGKMF